MNYFSGKIKFFADLTSSVDFISPFRLLEFLVYIKLTGFNGIKAPRLFCH